MHQQQALQKPVIPTAPLHQVGSKELLPLNADQSSNANLQMH